MRSINDTIGVRRLQVTLGSRVYVQMLGMLATIIFLFVNDPPLAANAFSGSYPLKDRHRHGRMVVRPSLRKPVIFGSPSKTKNAFERPTAIFRCGASASTVTTPTANLDADPPKKRYFYRWVSNIMQSFRKRGKSLVMTGALGLVLLFSQLPATSPTSSLSFIPTPIVEHVAKAQSIGTMLDNTGSLSSPSSLLTVASPRGGGSAESTLTAGAPTRSWERATERTLTEAYHDLAEYMRGPKSDTLILLLATALITPLCQRVKLSPILGFLASGMLLGPNGCGLISGIHTTETLAELGIVFFLFEMGIELSFDRLMSMRRDVFGLGFSQFMVTALAVAGVGKLAGQSASAIVVLGAGLALSSSAFVLQLLKDKNQLATRFGKAAFGILLFQDLAVVPLLVVTPILAGNGSGLAAALGGAVLKAAMALTSIAFAGRVLLNPLFKLVAQAQSQAAFLSVILLTVLSMSFLTVRFRMTAIVPTNTTTGRVGTIQHIGGVPCWCFAVGNKVSLSSRS
jgi:Sodium/hydrogen exchanger family